MHNTIYSTASIVSRTIVVFKLLFFSISMQISDMILKPPKHYVTSWKWFVEKVKMTCVRQYLRHKL